MTFVGKLVVLDGVRVHDDYEDMPVEMNGYSYYAMGKWSPKALHQDAKGKWLSSGQPTQCQTSIGGIVEHQMRKGYGWYSKYQWRIYRDTPAQRHVEKLMHNISSTADRAQE